MEYVKFQPTSVNQQGLTDLIRRLGRDCSPIQFLREFVQNGIEAVQRTGKEGRVIVDYNKLIYDTFGIHKICFIDTGDGMSPEQMSNLLNNLSASGEDKNRHENHGVGAKISAFSRNHAGIIYDSWKDGKGHRVTIKYSEQEDIYGIEGIVDSRGNGRWITQIPDSEKPIEISQHGTRVTLLGMTDDQDTMLVPANMAGSREAWISYFLNSRYFRIPQDIKMQARNGYYKEGSFNSLAHVYGQKHVLDEAAEIYGVTTVEETNYYWWVMPKDKSGKGRDLVKGHTAIVVQDEIFDIVDAKSNRVANFGVLAAPSRVIIYVEPKEGVLQHNVARTHIVNHDSTPVCWNKWYDDFHKNMPEKLRAFIAKELLETTSAGNAEEIEEKLKSVRELFRISRYAPSKKGKHYADPDSESEYKTAARRIGEPRPYPTPPKPMPDVIPGKTLSRMLTTLTDIDSGIQVEEGEPYPFPEVQFVHADLDDRESLRDRAAEYIENQNIIFANKDFQGYKDLIAHLVKIYGETPVVVSMIDAEVQKAFELALTECVTGAMSLKNRQCWPMSDFQKAISREALTTAVSGRYWMVSAIKRILGSKIKNYQPSLDLVD